MTVSSSRERASPISHRIRTNTGPRRSRPCLNGDHNQYSGPGMCTNPTGAHQHGAGRTHGFVFGAWPCPGGAAGPGGHGRGAHGQRPAELHAGGSGRCGSQGGARARALGHPQQRARVSAQPAHHGQSGPGRSAQGLGPAGFADRAGHPGGQRTDRRHTSGRLRVRR